MPQSMKKSLTLAAFIALFAAQSFAAKYIVVLKNGTSYAAKEKWKVVNGKAIVKLENGQSLQLDPALIDEARSEETTKFGSASASIIDLTTNMPKGLAKPKKPSIGDIKLKPKTDPQASTNKNAAPAVVVPAGSMTSQVIDKFQRAYENDGIFECKVVSTGERVLRVELTVDTEDRVFGAISTTAAMIVRNAFVEGAKIDMVELFMKTTTGGAAGRFQMSRADAEALLDKKVRREDYFISKVIY
ncbi:MAG: hypothetical protein M3P06_07800 [Acidobacteriota bacterium]|nr:hypothetical protein [Acidobacteriota bacterium]